MTNNRVRRPGAFWGAAGLLTTLVLGGSLAVMPTASAADEEAPVDYLADFPILGKGCPASEGLTVVVDQGSALYKQPVRAACDPLTGDGDRTDAQILKAAGFTVTMEGDGEDAQVCRINGLPEDGCARGSWRRTDTLARDAGEFTFPVTAPPYLPVAGLRGKTVGYIWLTTESNDMWLASLVPPQRIATRVETAGRHCTWHQGIGLAVDWTGTGKDPQRVDIMCLPNAAGVAKDGGAVDAYLPETLEANGHTVALRDVPEQHHAPARAGKPAQWICQIDGFPADGCEGRQGHWEVTRLVKPGYGDDRVELLGTATPLLTLTDAAQVPQGESWTIGARWVADAGVDYSAPPTDLAPWTPQIGVKEALAYRPEALDPEKPVGGTDPTTPPPGGDPSTPPPGGDPTTPPPGGDPTTPPPPGGDPSTPPPGGDPTTSPSTPPPGGATPGLVDQARAGAASWMARELQQAKPAYRLNRPVGDAPDWGLTADMVLGLSAAGGYPETVARTVDAIDTGASRYVDFGGGQVNASGAAKLLTVAAVAKKDPHTFVVKPGGGRFDLVSVVSERVSATGGPKGALVESNGTVANAFGQSYAIIGLSRTTAAGDGARQKMSDATAFLVRQQCPAGNVQLLQTEAGCSDKTPVDIDTTAMAAQAFYAADKAGVPGAKAAHAKAVVWLKTVQKPSGGFVGAPDFTPTQNSNSTGLAAVALTSGGATAEAARAAAWVSGMQAQCTTPGLGGDVGVVAYNAEAFAKGQAEGLGATDRARDAWRRASAQAVFAFAPIMLADLTLVTGQDTALATCEATVPPTGHNDGNTSDDGNIGDGDTGGDGGIGGGGIAGGDGGNGPGIGGVDPYGYAPAPRQPQQIDTGDTGGYQDQGDLATTGVHAAAILVAALVLIGIGTGFVLARRHHNN